jgi:hypothetical protein
LRRAVRETAPLMKLLRRGAVVGLLAGTAYAIWRALAARTPDTGGMTFQTQPFPSPPRPVPRVPTPQTALVSEPPDAPETATAPAAPAAGTVWVEPHDGACPVSHPVKAKMASGIFHLPGGGSYERTRADRCYLDAASAEADGLRAAKR